MRPILPIVLLVILVSGCGRGGDGSADSVVNVSRTTGADGAAATPRPVILHWDPTPAPTPAVRASSTPAAAVKAAVTPRPARTAVKATPRPPAKATVRPAARATARTATARPSTPRPAAAAATPRPKPATPKPGPSYEKEDVKARIRAAWPGDDEKAIRVVGCETAWTYNPRMTSSNGRYFGLWQFDAETWQRNGGRGDPRDHTPEEQTRVAWNLFQARGWAPWPHCGAD